ncbi:hypothetical protein GCM10027592_53110 [Spirosoma flavus]
MFSIILASLLVCVGYGWVLIDWYEDMRVGRYEREPLNTVIETGMILAYCYLAYRFLQSKMNDNPTPVSPRKEDSKTRSLRQSYSLLRKITTSATPTKIRAESAGWFSTRSQRLK